MIASYSENLGEAAIGFPEEAGTYSSLELIDECQQAANRTCREWTSRCTSWFVQLRSAKKIVYGFAVAVIVPSRLKIRVGAALRYWSQAWWLSVSGFAGSYRTCTLIHTLAAPPYFINCLSISEPQSIKAPPSAWSWSGNTLGSTKCWIWRKFRTGAPTGCFGANYERWLFRILTIVLVGWDSDVFRLTNSVSLTLNLIISLASQIADSPLNTEIKLRRTCNLSSINWIWLFI